MSRYSLLLSIVLLGLRVAPAPADDPVPLLPPDRPIEQAVDFYVDQLLQQEKVTPAPPAPDAALLRRLTLDLNGRIPTIAETAEYLASGEPQRKVQVVDRLFASPGFARHQAQEFAAILQVSEAPKAANKAGLQGYLLRSFTENRPWDQVFRELMLPDDTDPRSQGSGEFIKSRVKDLNRLTIDVSSIFFGVNVSCAQCHNHPHVPDWTQDHFYGMKSFFARTFENGGLLGEYDAGLVKYIPNKGQEKIAPVMFLTGKTLDVPNLREPTSEDKKLAQGRLDEAKKAKKTPVPPAYSVRARLVDTALEPGQREFFSRAIVNRLWARLFGRGLVMPLDQMHSENAASHPQLLEWLARDLVEHGYDLRRLVRGLVLSDAYARSSRWDADKVPADTLFAVAQARPLAPGQMAMSLRIATADPQTLPLAGPELDKRVEELAKGAERLAGLFQQPGDNFQVSVGEAMLFANNESLQKDLFDGGATLVARLLHETDVEKRADLAIRAVLSRPPQPNELKVLTDYLRRREDRPDAGCRQMVWALLTSAEFRFNH
jgi:hypothetical protein